jgi:hypothetical protein
MMSKSTYNNIVGPVLKDKDLWYVEREKNLNPLKNSREPIWLGGDGQFDSPEKNCFVEFKYPQDSLSGKLVTKI